MSADSDDETEGPIRAFAITSSTNTGGRNDPIGDLVPNRVIAV
jgi:hypothetical protein